MIRIGEVVGGYELVAKRKEGGMAALYVGRRVGLGGFTKEAAVKIVHERLTSTEAGIQMFLDEARVAARIDHPNVVHTYDVGQVGSTFYLVMEYVRGHSLAELLRSLVSRGTQLPVELAVWIVAQILAGLEAAHHATDIDGVPLEVVHRDVSPANVLIADSGHIKLIDFGIAQAAGRPGHHVEGTIRGKIRYMSPEQALGQAVDRRTDVYSAAVLLWELLTLRRFRNAASEDALLRQAISGHYTPPSRHRPGVPQALEGTLKRTLSIDPSKRPFTAESFRRALLAAVPEAASQSPNKLARILSEAMEQEGAKLHRFKEFATQSGEVEHDSAPTLTESNQQAVHAQRGRPTDWPRAGTPDPNCSGLSRLGGGVLAQAPTCSERAEVSRMPMVHAEHVRRTVKWLGLLFVCLGLTTSATAASIFWLRMPHSGKTQTRTELGVEHPVVRHVDSSKNFTLLEGTDTQR